MVVQFPRSAAAAAPDPIRAEVPQRVVRVVNRFQLLVLERPRLAVWFLDVFECLLARFGY